MEASGTTIRIFGERSGFKTCQSFSGVDKIWTSSRVVVIAEDADAGEAAVVTVELGAWIAGS